MNTATAAPERVVAVVNAPAKGGYPYWIAQVYELKPRKADGTLTYRKVGAAYAQPHRSKRLATQDAEHIAAQLDIPVWQHVRHGTTADQAAAWQEPKP